MRPSNCKIRQFCAIARSNEGFVIKNMQLVAENLACDRGDTRIFEGLSFSIGAGEGMLVTGPNGAGKSTLLRVLAGLLPLTAGSVELDVGTIAAHSHYLGPLNGMKAALTVTENLAFWRIYYGSGTITVEQALEQVGLAHVLDAPFSYLSTGQKRRVAIARLLLNDRPLWLLDEPTSGLDKEAEKLFADLVAEKIRNEGIVVAATHLPIDVAGMKHLRFEAEQA